jgi:hypothetical protein
MLLIVFSVAILIGSCAGFGVYGFIHLADFLSVTAPVTTNTLIIEGWIPDYAVREASLALQNGTYQRALIVGPPLGKGAYLTEYQTVAQVTAATLVQLGVAESRLVVIPCPRVDNYRTYAAACTVQQWLQANDPTLQTVNVFTLAAHARRSWLIYRHTLTPPITVGIIAARSHEIKKYEGWWRTSAGFRHVVSEAIAYAYARFIDWRA